MSRLSYGQLPRIEKSEDIFENLAGTVDSNFLLARLHQTSKEERIEVN